MRICLTCGDLADKSYCDECYPTKRKEQRANNEKKNPRKNGYDSRWERLSKRARKLQPFCTDCGTTEDLQADHTPEAWERYYSGKAIRLQDIDVVCGLHNRERGAARPDSDPQGGEGKKFQRRTPSR